MDEREQRRPGDEEEQVERDIEVSDLDVEDEAAGGVSGGLTVNPSEGGEVRRA